MILVWLGAIFVRILVIVSIVITAFIFYKVIAYFLRSDCKKEGTIILTVGIMGAGALLTIIHMVIGFSEFKPIIIASWACVGFAWPALIYLIIGNNKIKSI